MADDDFVWPGTIYFVCDLIILTLYFVRSVLKMPFFGPLFPTLSAAMIVQWVCLAMDAHFSLWSLRGAILSTDKRRCFPYALMARLLALVAQLILSVMVAVASGLELAVLTYPILGVIWVLLIGMVLFVCSGIFGVGEEHILVGLFTGLLDVAKFFTYDKEHAHDDLHKLKPLVTDVFEEADLAISDLLAGITLLGCTQKARREGGHAPGIPELDLGKNRWTKHDQQLLDRSSGGMLGYTNPLAAPRDKDVVPDLARFVTFAKVVYEDEVEDVRTKLREARGHEESELLYFQERNDFLLPVYGVFVDVYRKYVVVSIRGTSSLHDVLTDIAANCVEISDPALLGQKLVGKRTGLVHKGAWEAAQNIDSQLTSKGILKALFGNDKKLAQVPLLHWQNCAGFGLMVTGHSLGAGTACLLAPLLRKSFSGARGILYAPVPVCSANISDHIAPGSLSMILGDDIVPRLSLRNLILARDLILALLARDLMKKAFLAFVGSEFDWETLGGAQRVLAKDPISPLASNVNRRVREAGKPYSRFHHGSRVCYMRVTHVRHTWLSGKEDFAWRPEWATCDDFQEIVVSRSCLAHHKLDAHIRALNHIVAAQGKRTE